MGRPKKNRSGGYCLACNKFTGHFAEECPNKPLVYKFRRVSEEEGARFLERSETALGLRRLKSKGPPFSKKST